MSLELAVKVSSLSYSYGDRKALDNVSFSVTSGEFFGVVGPNGGGKSTTFKILSTLVPVKSGTIEIFGDRIEENLQTVRAKLGVVFQFAALDKKLTVEENLWCQGYLYQITGARLKARIELLLSKVDLLDRRKEKVEKLSGGLKRRLEIAKSLLHEPRILILDEPTTGLDPLARKEIIGYLRQLSHQEGITVLLTTHLLDEADLCDHMILLDQGKIVAFDSPTMLKQQLGGEIITVRTKDPKALRDKLASKSVVSVRVVDDELRIENVNAVEFIPGLVKEFSGEIESLTLGKPTLEDFFLEKTGRRFWHSEKSV